MKHVVIAIMICFLMILNYSCKKCKDYTHIGFAKITNEYFGNYKPGAYWIYLNRDSTKRDSIWIDNYKKIVRKDRLETCISTDEIKFDMHSQFLHYYILNVSIYANTYIDGLTNYLDMTDFLYLTMRDDSLSFYKNNESYPVLKNYSLWQGNATSALPKVIRADGFVFAPNIGLVQYVPSFGDVYNDTFSLIKYYIP